MGVPRLTGATAVLATAAAALFAGPPTVETIPILTATALFLGGTFNEMTVPQESSDFISYYVGAMNGLYVTPTGLCNGGDPGCTGLGVYTPEQLRGVTGWGDMTFDKSVATGVPNVVNCLRGSACLVTLPPYTASGPVPLTDSSYTVFSYSQSGTIANTVKKNLIADPATAAISFVFLANPNRPNGGILERFHHAYLPVLGVSFNGATPNDSAPSAPLTTVDVAGQYDLISDFPNHPLNLLADVNSIAAYYLVHLTPFDIPIPALQGQYRDTTYYLLPQTTLPLLWPIAQIPYLGPFAAAVLDPPLRVLVERGYNRKVNPGSATPARWMQVPRPIKTTIDVLRAIPTGWDNGIAYLTGNTSIRPFGTTAPGPYGVGGPSVYTGTVDPYGPATPYHSANPAATPSASAVIPSAATAIGHGHSGSHPDARPTTAQARLSHTSVIRARSATGNSTIAR